MATLYLKYRPKTIDELDLKDVRDTLTKIIKSGNIPHAFLFSGPKGTGKTSAARLIAKIVNCEKRRKNSIVPCNECKQCLSITQGNNIDVIEMDAASNRGIDDIRALRDAVKLSTASVEKKIYIIDEAHMLTTEASNALLKTLEEPPDHVIFILATTNPEKLIETIRSRAVNIIFRKASNEEIVRSLKKVVKGEKLRISDDSLILIAKASDGSFRDATKILEQITTDLKSYKKENIENFLFGSIVASTKDMIDALIEKDIKKALNEVEKAYQSGIEMTNLIQEILEELRKELLNKEGVGESSMFKNLEKHEVIQIIKLMDKAYSEIQNAVLEQLPLELAIVNWCGKDDNGLNTDDFSDDVIKSGDNEDIQKNNFSKKELSGKKYNRDNGISEEVWNEILSRVKPQNTSTEALLRATAPKNYDGKTLTLSVYYSFHKERLEHKDHRNLLEKVVKNVVGNPVRIICTLDKPPQKSKKDETVLVEPNPEIKEEEKDIIKMAEEIFGS